jgi:hypothetical protein
MIMQGNNKVKIGVNMISRNALILDSQIVSTYLLC